MKIPEDAIIPEEKFTKYLLVEREFDDKSKFLFIAGFTLENYPDLVGEIKRLLKTEKAIIHREDEYGSFYKVTGLITGPSGYEIRIVTVWLHRKVDGLFQFITLYPERKN